MPDDESISLADIICFKKVGTYLVAYSSDVCVLSVRLAALVRLINALARLRLVDNNDYEPGPT